MILKSTPPVWAGTLNGIRAAFFRIPLNPPRPCGRGLSGFFHKEEKHDLKSTPPVWAGTKNFADIAGGEDLKSTPPVWAGTYAGDHRAECKRLKSTPPVWAGTS